MSRAKASIPIEVKVGSSDDDAVISEGANGVNEEAAKRALDRCPLFSGFDLEEDQEIDHIIISRVKPIREGDLGTLHADADQEYIREQFGGGTFELRGRNSRKKMLKGAYRTVELAGDPIFTSDIARKQWEQLKRQKFGSEAVQSLDQVSNIYDEREEQRHRRELERIKADSEATIMRLRAEAEVKEAIDAARRRTEREERDEERRREREEARTEREEREAKDEARWRQDREDRRLEREAAEAREAKRWEAEREDRRLDREKSGDPMTLIMKGVDLAFAMRDASSGEGAYPDAATAFVAKMPEIVEGARGLLGDVAMAGAAKNPGTPTPTARAAKGKAEDEEVRLDAVMSKEVIKTAKKLQAQGKDPAKVLSAEFNRALKRINAMEEVKPDAKPAAPKKLSPKPALKKLPPKKK